MLVVGAILVVFDFQNLLSWWRGKLVTAGWRTTSDFTIVVPLFGHPRYFEGRAAIEGYRANVLVALEVTPPLMQEFAETLEAEGWKVLRTRMPSPNPAALMKEAVRGIATTYTIRLDADTYIGPGLEKLVAAVEASGADLCSVKVEAEGPCTIAARLQALEYRMAMLSRHFRPWMTSGACYIGKTDSLKLIFDKHTLWTPGEDIETGRAAHALKLKIRHGDFVVTTDVPQTWLALYRQRRLWWAGTFRHICVNADRNLLHLPIVTCYTLLAVFASLYFKWWAMIDLRAMPLQIPLILLTYALVTFVSNLQVRSWWMIVFPLYALVQTLVMPLLGAGYYFVLLRRKGTPGRYLFGYRRRTPPGVLEQLRLERLGRAATGMS